MKVRKKPVVVDAWSVDDLLARAASGHEHLPEEVRAAYDEGVIEFEADHIAVITLEGAMFAPRGWHIIRGVKGEFYPCEDSIYVQTYDEVAETDLGVIPLPKPDVPGPYDHSPEL